MLAVAAPSSAQVYGYVTDNLDRTVSVIDTATFTVTGTIPLDENVEPYGVVAHPDSLTVYLSC